MMGLDCIHGWIEQGDGYVKFSTTVGIQILRAVFEFVTISQLSTVVKHNEPVNFLFIAVTGLRR